MLAIALALALAEPPTPVALPMATPSLSEAQNAIAQGRLDQARAMLGSAIAAGAKGEPVDRLLGDLEYASGRFDKALPYYQLLLTSHPSEALLLERGGISALQLGKTADAVALLDRATRAAGAGWRAWNARGVAADREGRWDEADAAYIRAAQMAPGQAEVPNNQGWSLMLRGRWAEALTRFGQAQAINPSLPRLANNLELARDATAAALPPRRDGESDESYSARLNDAGVVAEAAGDLARAKAAFAQAIELRSRWYRLAADNLAAVDRTP